MDFLGVAQAGGVLEVGDDIDELSVGIGLDGLRELLAVDAVGVDLDGDDLGVEHVEGLQGHKIGGIFHQDLVTGVDHAHAQHGQGLL